MRRKTLVLRGVLSLLIGIIPGAIGGSFLIEVLPKYFIPCATAVIASISGTFTMREAFAVRPVEEPATNLNSTPSTATIEIACHGATPSESSPETAATQPARESDKTAMLLARVAHVPRQQLVLFCLGTVIGTFSVLTGTGGPFIAIPLLFATQPDLSSVQAIALAQTAGIPISVIVAVTLGLHSASVDLGLALLIGVATSAGVPIGGRLVHSVRPSRIKLAVGVFLIAIGSSTLYFKVIHDFL